MYMCGWNVCIPIYVYMYDCFYGWWTFVHVIRVFCSFAPAVAATAYTPTIEFRISFFHCGTQSTYITTCKHVVSEYMYILRVCVTEIIQGQRMFTTKIQRLLFLVYRAARMHIVANYHTHTRLWACTHSFIQWHTHIDKHKRETGFSVFRNVSFVNNKVVVVLFFLILNELNFNTISVVYQQPAAAAAAMANMIKWWMDSVFFRLFPLHPRLEWTTDEHPHAVFVVAHTGGWFTLSKREGKEEREGKENLLQTDITKAKHRIALKANYFECFVSLSAILSMSNYMRPRACVYVFMPIRFSFFLLCFASFLCVISNMVDFYPNRFPEASHHLDITCNNGQ